MAQCSHNQFRLIQKVLILVSIWVKKTMVSHTVPLHRSESWMMFPHHKAIPSGMPRTPAAFSTIWQACSRVKPCSGGKTSRAVESSPVFGLATRDGHRSQDYEIQRACSNFSQSGRRHKTHEQYVAFAG